MFSHARVRIFFAFALGALVARAAPSFQTPMPFKSNTSIAHTHGPMTAAIPTGKYAIFSYKHATHPGSAQALYASQRDDERIYFPGVLAGEPASHYYREWFVSPNENFEYTMLNVGLRAAVYADSEDKLFAGPGDEPLGFHVQPIGLESEPLFVIKVLQQDRVWTRIEDGAGGATVALTPYGQPAGSESQFWKMVRVD
ncbi:hypothetical protein B0H12DRAFT_1237251 [Mycena haematopus]|nr:hypothetical protein B0H12DRAFT_1237251 [Mycena haematopus]